ncbi:MAG TPA: ATP-binding protein [Acidobacteriota bacterium]|jgi:PAS domain S-box-containing protein
MVKFRTVAGKLVFFSVALVVFTAVVFAVTLADLNRRTLSGVKEVNQTVLKDAVQKEWEEKCRDLTKLLAYELTQPLQDLNVAAIDNHVSSALRERDVRYLYVHDENGGVLFGAGEGADAVGQVFTDVISRNAVATRELLTQKQIGIVDIAAPVFFGSRKVGTVRAGFSTDRIESSTAKLNAELRGRIGDAMAAALRITLLAVLIISAGTALVGSISVRRLLQPVRMLALGTQKLSSGDLGFRLPVTSQDEIGQLAHSFNRMSEDLQKTTVSREALRTSELRTRAVIDNLLEGLATINEAGIIETVNPAAEKMFGYPAREMIGQPLTMLFAEERAKDTVEFMKFLRETAVGHAGEWEAQRSDSSTFPIELTLSEFSVLQDKHFIANIRDLSERREVDRLKREFVSTVSHELRTPLTSIRGSLSLLAGGALGRVPDEASEVIALAERNTIRLITLINDMLDLERLESGKLEMNFETIPLSSVLQTSVESIQNFADLEQVRIELPSSEAEIFADRARIVQVMVNLLSNAVKFSERGSTVCLSTREVPGWVEISVADSGRGIAAAYKRVIFERFRQVESHDSRQKGGTGLGLTICKAIIEQHGGAIGVESEEGKGSTFWIRVPAGLKKQDFVQRQAGEIARKQAPSPILVGDPDPAARRQIESILRKEGHQVVLGSSAVETWDILRKSELSMAILDSMLVEDTDQDLLEKVLEDSRLQHVPLIMVGDNLSLSPDRLSQNVAVFIPKPVNENQLLEAIRETLRRSGMRDILLVEDDEVLLQVMARQLGQEGISVRTATTGRQAIALALQSAPGLMVLDVGLPDGDGFDVVDALRREPVLKRIPLLVYTGRDLTAEQRGQLTLGATRFLTKSEATDEQFRSLVVSLLHKSMETAPEA